MTAPTDDQRNAARGPTEEQRAAAANWLATRDVHLRGDYRNSLGWLLAQREAAARAEALAQVAALREAAARLLDVQQKWHGAKSADEVAFWDKAGPEAYDELKRALVFTADAAATWESRVRAEAIEEYLRMRSEARTLVVPARSLPDAEASASPSEGGE